MKTFINFLSAAILLAAFFCGNNASAQFKRQYSNVTNGVNTNTNTNTNTNVAKDNELTFKSFNNGQLNVPQVVLKEGTNLFAVNKGASVQVIQKKGIVEGMYNISSNGIKSTNLVTDLKSVVKIHGGLGFQCGIISCTCQGDDDCNKMFSTNVCTGGEWCDADTGKCYCISLR